MAHKILIKVKRWIWHRITLILGLAFLLSPAVALAIVTVVPGTLTNVNTSWTVTADVTAVRAYVYAADGAYMMEDDVTGNPTALSTDYPTPQAGCTDRGTPCTPTGAWHVVTVLVADSTACGFAGPGTYTNCVASAGFLSQVCFIIGSGSCAAANPFKFWYFFGW